MFNVVIKPVDLAREVRLPEPWPKLSTDGFHGDLMLRAKGFMLQATRLGYEEPATEFLRRIGEGFTRKFEISRFGLSADDPDFALKQQALLALKELSDEFGDRVSTIVWDTLAFLATRPDPKNYSTILSSQKHLPFPWWVADTCLHGLGKVYGFKLHVDSRIFAKTGMILEHNCDCGCDIHPAGDDGVIKAELKKERFPLATAALFSHLLGESLLIMALKMPFEMGLSPEAAEVMALQV